MKFLLWLCYAIIIYTITYLFGPSEMSFEHAALIKNLPGFWDGLFHGWVMVTSLVLSIFTDNTIYAIANSGGWYNFGYACGVITVFNITFRLMK